LPVIIAPAGLTQQMFTIDEFHNFVSFVFNPSSTDVYYTGNMRPDLGLA
jgi:hypothetical protein